jgi:hypothetical protein
MAIHILGIRHHGVGSAKNVQEQLARLKPDVILVEGPPEITPVLASIGNEALVPPVAVMVYNSEQPKESTFYPFAEYSPEWVAIAYANKNRIPVRTMDLPAAVSFQKRSEQKALPNADNEEGKLVKGKTIYREPLSYLAEVAGLRSGEEWWDHHFEQEKKIDPQHFEAVIHSMEALRLEGLESSLDQENIDREAFMRNIIRQTQNEMYDRIVVVCGAWHAPALIDLDGTAKSDAKILKELPKSKIKIASTWIPWTNARLSMFSGYGAGIYSPGWYEHQWKTPEDAEIKWLTKVAETFRNKGMDISTAHVIEAFNLSRSLSVLRKKSYVSLDELNEATLAVMCMGDSILLQLVKDKLIVGNKLGKVPSDIPKVPLQEDFEQNARSLKLKLSAAPKQYDLDLRKEYDLARSIFFHRLQILEIPWMKRTSTRTKGTFKESWVAEWTPEMMVELIDKAFLGNTVEAAAQAVVLRQCTETHKVAEVAELIQLSIPAALYENLDDLLGKINELSTISADIIDLMNAIPRLVEVCRYGDVRKSDLTVLNNIVQQLLIKVFVGLPNACYGLDEDNSNMMFTLIAQVNSAVRLYEEEIIQQQWYDTLHKLVDKAGVHPIILGCVCRLLLDAQQLTEEETDRRISFALSPANDPHHVAAWLEGFLRGSGMILIYDNRLWNLLYAWVASLPEDIFMELLALLRRAFSKFEFGERRQIGEKSKKGLITEEKMQAAETDNFNAERARSILPTIKALLGNA